MASPPAIGPDAESDQSLREYFESIYRKGRTLRDGSIGAYHQEIRKLGEFPGRPASLDELSDEVLTEYSDSQSRSGLSAGTRRKTLATLFALWRHAHRKNLAEFFKPFGRYNRYDRQCAIPRTGGLLGTADRIVVHCQGLARRMAPDLGSGPLRSAGRGLCSRPADRLARRMEPPPAARPQSPPAGTRTSHRGRRAARRAPGSQARSRGRHIR